MRLWVRVVAVQKAGAIRAQVTSSFRAGSTSSPSAVVKSSRSLRRTSSAASRSVRDRVRASQLRDAGASEAVCHAFA